MTRMAVLRLRGMGLLTALTLLTVSVCARGDIDVSGDWSPGTGPTSNWLWSLGDHLTLGLTQSGSLSVSEGAWVFNLYGILGSQSTGSGTVLVSGTGSRWQSSGTTVVGQSGTGALTVSQGGQAVSTAAELGSGLGAVGTALVTDSGSRWDVSRTLTVGTLGTGTLNVRDSGRVVSGRGVIAQDVGSVGTVTVTGAGTLLAATGYGDMSLTVGSAGTGTLTIADGGVVVSGQGRIAESAGSSGTVSLTGTASRWSNHAGALYVGGSSSGVGGTGLLSIGAGASVDADAVTIWQTGTVQGGGTLEGRAGVTHYGTLAPGDGLGTLTVTGDLTVASGSTVTIEVDNSGQSDRVAVTGDLAIQGGTLKAVGTETITEEHTYTVMTADQVTGTFDVLDTALLTTTVVDGAPTLAYGAQQVQLRVQARPFTDAALTQTETQAAVGGALQRIALGGGSAVTAAVQQLAGDAAVRAAYDELSGRHHLGVAPVTVAATDRFGTLVSDRLEQARVARAGRRRRPLLALEGNAREVSPGTVTDANPLGPVLSLGTVSGMGADQPWGLWARGYSLFGDREQRATAVGYGYDVLGGAAGLDRRLDDSWLVGVTGGISRGDIGYTDASATDFEGTLAGLYAHADCERGYGEGILSLSDLDYETRRAATVGGAHTLSGQFGGREVSAYVEVGTDWVSRCAWRIQPLAGFRVAYVRLDGYTESGGLGATRFATQRYRSYRGSLGVKLERPLPSRFDPEPLWVQIRGRWHHEFGDTTSRVDASFADSPAAVFTVTDRDLPHDSATLGLGLHARLREATELRLDYDTRFSRYDQSHLLTGQVAIRW